MASRAEVLDLTEGMPERHLVVGERLYAQGADSESSVAVLVEGALRVEIGGSPVSDITIPGAFVGELTALLRTDRTADVVATSPATVRVIGDPEAFFATHPELALELSRQLAARLQRLMAYLGDLRRQYADSEGHLAMVDAVLGRIASRPVVEIEPGSDRSADYDA